MIHYPRPDQQSIMKLGHIDIVRNNVMERYHIQNVSWSAGVFRIDTLNLTTRYGVSFEMRGYERITRETIAKKVEHILARVDHLEAHRRRLGL